MEGRELEGGGGAVKEATPGGMGRGGEGERRRPSLGPMRGLEEGEEAIVRCGAARHPSIVIGEEKSIGFHLLVSTRIPCYACHRLRSATFVGEEKGKTAEEEGKEDGRGRWRGSWWMEGSS